MVLRFRRICAGEAARGSPLLVHTEQLRQQIYASTWIFSAIGQRRLPQGAWDGILQGRDTGSGAAWREAITRLETDADAMLPADPASDTAEGETP
jgi:hypothetical protein